MMEFDPEKCRAAARQAETDDLLDQVTAYRRGLEPEAIELIEQELRRRGVTQAAIADRAEECRRECLLDDTGTALKCSRCQRPAVAQVLGWHRLWGILPLFPRSLRVCKEHRPGG
jgi:hypothetical protein